MLGNKNEKAALAVKGGLEKAEISRFVDAAPVLEFDTQTLGIRVRRFTTVSDTGDEQVLQSAVESLQKLLEICCYNRKAVKNDSTIPDLIRWTTRTHAKAVGGPSFSDRILNGLERSIQCCIENNVPIKSPEGQPSLTTGAGSQTVPRPAAAQLCSISSTHRVQLSVQVSKSLLTALRSRLNDDGEDSTEIIVDRSSPSSRGHPRLQAPQRSITFEHVDRARLSRRTGTWPAWLRQHVKGLAASGGAIIGGIPEIFRADPNLSRQQMLAYCDKWIDQTLTDDVVSDNADYTVALLAYEEAHSRGRRSSQDPNEDDVLENSLTASRQVVGILVFNLGPTKSELKTGVIELLAVKEGPSVHVIHDLPLRLIAQAFEYLLHSRHLPAGKDECLQRIATLNVSLSAARPAMQKMFRAAGFQEASEGFRYETDWHFWPKHEKRQDMNTQSIPNNRPYLDEDETLKYLQESLKNIATHAVFGPKCESLLQKQLGGNCRKAVLVNSGTSGLQLCCLALGLGLSNRATDEVIVPSYTFVSTANAFVIHNCVPVFVDIRHDTQNIDETQISAVITENTRAVCVVHYAGVACDMDEVRRVIKDNSRGETIRIIEDNAHGVFSKYKGESLGTIGDLGVLSFHYTKNLVCGEGGAVLINRPELISPVMVALEKGTNRFDFLMGKVDHYAWVDRGASFVLSDILAAVLYAQLKRKACIMEKRMEIWELYYAELHTLLELNRGEEPDSTDLQLPHIPSNCTHNAHIFYVRIADKDKREKLLQLAKERGPIGIYSHYPALHNASGGVRYGKTFANLDGGTSSQHSISCLPETDRCAAELLRLPMWIGMSQDMVRNVVEIIKEAVFT